MNNHGYSMVMQFSDMPLSHAILPVSIDTIEGQGLVAVLDDLAPLGVCKYAIICMIMLDGHPKVS
jgi:hypothetical protein